MFKFNDFFRWPTVPSDSQTYSEPEQIVLRRWEDEVSLEFEFRAFVFKGKVKLENCFPICNFLDGMVGMYRD